LAKESAKAINIGSHCEDKEIDWREEFVVGFGRARDSNGSLYATRVYFTKQKSKLLL
jgi:hypothetical protein